MEFATLSTPPGLLNLEQWVREPSLVKVSLKIKWITAPLESTVWEKKQKNNKSAKWYQITAISSQIWIYLIFFFFAAA